LLDNIAVRLQAFLDFFKLFRHADGAFGFFSEGFVFLDLALHFLYFIVLYLDFFLQLLLGAFFVAL